jgi:hypothetical protein
MNGRDGGIDAWNVGRHHLSAKSIVTWRQSIARKLRAVAGWLDPQGRPGRKRKARTECAHKRVNPNCGPDNCSPMCLDCGKLLPFELADAPLLHGFPQEIEEPRA